MKLILSDFFFIPVTVLEYWVMSLNSTAIKTESIRKLSNFDFQWTQILYQNIKTISHCFLHFSRAMDVISYLL